MRLENSYERKKNKTKLKNTNTWRLNNMVQSNQSITEKFKEEIKKHLETDENENMMLQNLWNASKAIQKGKFIAILSYLRKQENPKKQLNLHLNN